LVASAGFGTSGEFTNAEIETEVNMVDVNVSSVLRMAHAFAQRLKERGSGAIILMSSIVAFQGVARAANYSATKAYVQTLGEGLQIELAPYGVDVLLSAPGPVKSGFAERADMNLGNALSATDAAEGTLRALGRSNLVRPGTQSKVLGYSLAITPRRVRTRIMARVMKGFTEHLQ
jgi:hypothetical protein